MEEIGSWQIMMVYQWRAAWNVVEACPKLQLVQNETKLTTCAYLLVKSL